MPEANNLNTPTETFGHPNVKHPYANHTLADAVRVANGIADVRLQASVTSLSQARELVQSSMNACSHQWITGFCALDVLDASIDGRDLLASNRLGV
jgi:hypothetical protein